ncbi:hypothetical protein CTheo_4100 [Ceratobasidium theobromae]|uniref:DRBM domain-containing protein n=1 Tax=Ceratobasidium theobromae TaxID=1582974 RepID=A0A5N5QLK4_9AGAM|nr:hypothetical protein CTheo_4100 [Ceratobasidium theobromae]
MLPALPPIHSASLRKHAFTDISVFRLPSDADLDQVQNTDNDRLAFLGRAALDYALAGHDAGGLDEKLASCAYSYDIVRFLHVAWRPTDAPNSNSAVSRAEAARLMEAYVGALLLEAENEAMAFARDLVRSLFNLPSPPPLPLPVVPALHPTGSLHDLATRHGIQLAWQDSPEGPNHAHRWISVLTLRHIPSGRTWPSIARGTATSKKLARADAAARVLPVWDSLLIPHV